MLSTPPKKSPDSLWPVLAGIRFALALIVAATHLPSFYGRHPHHEFIECLRRFSGVTSVFAFLVLSGYSIAASFEKDAADFYFRRALRILPQYVAIVVGSAFLPAFFPVRLNMCDFEVPAYDQLALNLCFGQGFFTLPIFNDRVIWSLSVEVFFYACTPFFARLTQKRLRQLIVLSAAFYAIQGVIWQPTFWDLTWGINVPLLAWIWLAGFWIYREKEKTRALLFVGILGLVVIPMNWAIDLPWGPITWAGTILGLAFGARAKLGARTKVALLFLGDISYPLYLIHVPTFALLFGLGFEGGGWFIVGAIGAAACSELCVDRPIKHLIRRLHGPNPRHFLSRGAVANPGAPLDFAKELATR